MQMDVKPGDQIWVYVGFGNSDHNNGYDGFLVEDLTQGTSAVHYEYDPNRFSDSATAECIVERPVYPAISVLISLLNLDHTLQLQAVAYIPTAKPSMLWFQ